MEYHRAPHDISGKPSFHISDDFNNNLYQIERFVRLVEETENLPYPKYIMVEKKLCQKRKDFWHTE
jgi:hypothetical protein